MTFLTNLPSESGVTVVSMLASLAVVADVSVVRESVGESVVVCVSVVAESEIRAIDQFWNMTRLRCTFKINAQKLYVFPFIYSE